MTDNNSGILIYAQITREGFIHPVFFELLSKAKELSKKLKEKRNSDKEAVLKKDALISENFFNENLNKD